MCCAGLDRRSEDDYGHLHSLRKITRRPQASGFALRLFGPQAWNSSDLKANSEVGFREETFFETTIDLAELARLAHKAAKNRTGKAHHGAISVKILATRRGTNEDIQL